MLKIDAEENIAALMDSVSGLLCSEATRLQESTAATPCAVWVESQGGTLIVALLTVPESAWRSYLSGAVRAVCSCRIGCRTRVSWCSLCARACTIIFRILMCAVRGDVERIAPQDRGQEEAHACFVVRVW